MLSLSMTPLKTVSGWSWTANARKWFGLYAFFYALIHLLVFIGWDYGFAWQFIWPEILQKRYLIVGLSAFTILFLLAGTSFRWWTDRLGRGWTWLHRLVYAAGVLVILHFAWVKKGDIFTLKGDVIEPFIYGVIFLLLMLLRIPAIRRKMSTGRRRHRRKQQSTTGTVVVRRMKHTDQGVQGE
jgi:sulfoxide reductase heme-binding subunit YedZ